LSILQPEKVATPEVVVALQPDRVPLAGLVPMARVTVELSVVTVLPPASWTTTTGWVVKARPPVAPAGWVEKTSWDAVPTVTVKLVEVMPVSPEAEAERV